MGVPKNFKARIKKELKEIARQRRNAMAKRLRERKKEIVQHVIDTIRDDIRNNAMNPATGKKFKALAPSTIDTRRRIVQKNKAHPNYKEASPNLTITGRFLDGMRGKLTGGIRKGFDISLFFKGVHKKYRPLTKRKWVKKQPKRARVMNADIHDAMIALGRDPLNLSEKMFKEVNAFVSNELTKAFSKE